MRRSTKRFALLLLIVTILALIYWQASRDRAGPVYLGLTAASWEDEAESLANTMRSDVGYRIGEELRQLAGRATRLQRFMQLAEGKDAEAIPMLTALLESPSAHARLTATSGLRSRGLLAKPALPLLRKAMDDDADRDVRHMAGQVIRNLEFLERSVGASEGMRSFPDAVKKGDRPESQRVEQGR